MADVRLTADLDTGPALRSAAGLNAVLKGLGQNSSMGKFNNEVASARKAFEGLYATGTVMTSAFGTLAGTLGAVGGGLVTVGAAAASAASSVVALGGALSVASQAGITAAIAFKGVGAALSAGFKNATAQAKATQGVAKSTAGLVAAQRALADATRRLKDQERDLLSARKELLATEKALSQARKDAIEELQQLNFSVEDAALAEERAAINLEKAYEAYMRMAHLPVDDRGRQEAELAFKEADLNYRMAKDKAGDLAEAQAKANEKGIEGTKAYTDAQNKVISAQNKVQKAEEAVAKAKQDVARQQEDLNRALADYKKAGTDAAKAADAYAEALGALTPAARKFVEQLVALKPQLTAIRKLVQENFFSKINASFKTMAETYLPLVEDRLGMMATILGRTFDQLFTELTKNSGAVDRIMANNNRIMGIFSTRGREGKSAIEALTSVFVKLLEAIQPVTERFADFLSAQLILLDMNTTVESMTAFFDRAGERAARFGSIFGNIFKTGLGLAKAADPAITKMFDYWELKTKGMQDAVEANQGSLQAYFQAVQGNMEPLFDLLGQIGMVLLKMGANPALGETFRLLQDAVPYLEKILTAGSDAGPALARAVVQIARMAAAFADSGAMKTFFVTLEKMATGVAEVFETELGQKVLAVMGQFGAVAIAISTAWTMIGKTVVLGVLGPMISKLMGMGAAVTEAGTVMAALKTTAGTLGASFSGIGKILQFVFGKSPWILAITAVVAIFVTMWKRNEQFRESIKNLLSVLGGAFMQIFNAIKPLFETVAKVIGGLVIVIADALAPVLADIIDIFARWVPMISQVITVIISILVPVFQVLIGIVGAVLVVVIKLIGFFFKLYTSVVKYFFGFLADMYNKHVKGPLDSVIKGFQSMSDKIMGIPQKIGEKWAEIKKKIADPVNVAIGAVNWLIRGLNTLTGWTGMKPIGEIKPMRYADGGEVKGPGGPRSDRIPALLSNGEYVLKEKAARSLGTPMLNALNQHGTGGLFDWIKDKAASTIGGALDNLVGKALDTEIAQKLRGMGGVGKLFFGLIDKMRDDWRSWGQKKDDERNAQETSGGGSGAPYVPVPGAKWGYPLARRYPARTFRGHNPVWALDIGGAVGTPVLAVAAGRIAKSANLGNRSYGKYIVINHGSARTTYAHLNSIIRGNGLVEVGEKIGTLGNTGGSSGPHLHFEYTPSARAMWGSKLSMRGRGVKMATGGVVRATPGGVLTMLAEGGKHERVEPLDSQGLSARDRALIEQLTMRSTGGSNVVVRVYIGDEELRDMVRYEVVESDRNKAVAAYRGGR